MSRKKKHDNRVPPGNRSQAGTLDAMPQPAEEEPTTKGAPMQEQDEKRRLGNYETAGEHAFQQPGGRNDANR